MDGNYLAVGYGPHSKEGYLGKIDITGCNGLYLAPATLNQADGTDPLQLSSFHAVGRSATDQAQKTWTPSINNDKCTSGASVGLSGSMSAGITPTLTASYRFFKLTSATFSLTGHATATLQFDAHVKGTCTITPTPISTTIATFAGVVGPLPVVIVLKGKLTISGQLTAQAQAQAGLRATAQLTEGIQYKSRKWTPIEKWYGAIGPYPAKPTITGSAGAKITITPEIDALLYGIAGPAVSLDASLSFNTNPSANPWWTATAPLYLNASFAGLGPLSDHKLTVHIKTYNLGNGGPFPGSTGGTGMTGSTGNTGGTAPAGPIAIDTGAGLDNVACPSAAQCTAVFSGGEVTFNPEAPGVAPTTPTGVLDGFETVTGVACPTTSQCTVVGSDTAQSYTDGNEATFNPQSPGTPAATSIDSSSALDNIACTAPTRCTAVDHANGEITFNPQALGSPSPSQVPPDNGGGAYAAVACPIVTQCAAIIGPDVVTFNPQSPDTVGTEEESDGQAFYGLACPTAVQCTAVDSGGQEATFNPQDIPQEPVGTPAPGGDVLTINTTSVLGGGYLAGLSCPITTQCTAISYYGGSAATFNPESPGAPTSAVIDTAGGLRGVDCPTATQCTAVDDSGQEVTFNPQAL